MPSRQRRYLSLEMYMSTLLVGTRENAGGCDVRDEGGEDWTVGEDSADVAC